MRNDYQFRESILSSYYFNYIVHSQRNYIWKLEKLYKQNIVDIYINLYRTSSDKQFYGRACCTVRVDCIEYSEEQVISYNNEILASPRTGAKRIHTTLHLRIRVVASRARVNEMFKLAFNRSYGKHGVYFMPWKLSSTRVSRQAREMRKDENEGGSVPHESVARSEILRYPSRHFLSTFRISFSLIVCSLRSRCNCARVYVCTMPLRCRSIARGRNRETCGRGRRNTFAM